MHESGGNEEKKDGVSNPSNDPAGSEAVVKANSQNEIEAPSQAADDAQHKQKRKMKFRQRWNQTSLPNRLNIVLTAIICFATIANVLILRKQVNDQDKQVGQITSAIAQGITNAKGAIDASLAQNRVALESILEQNRAALETFREESRRISDETLTQNREALTTTIDQANAALDVSIKASRSAQRPWVTVPGMFLLKEPEVGEEIRINMRLINSGNSPAIRVTNQTAVTISRTIPEAPPFSDNPAEGQGGVIYPGQRDFQISTDPFKATDELIESYRARESRLIYWAIRWYQDVFGVSHWTTVCGWRIFGTPLGLTNHCPEGNDIDQNDDRTDPVSPPSGGSTMQR